LVCKWDTRRVGEFYRCNISVVYVWLVVSYHLYCVAFVRFSVGVNKGGEQRMKTTLYLDPDTRQKARELAKRYKVSISAIVRIAIERMWREEVTEE